MGRGVNAPKPAFWREAVANMRVDVSAAAYTKVPQTWRDLDYTPDFNKLYFIMEGTGYLAIDGAEYEPRPGQLFWLPQGVRQSYSATGGDPFGKHWCHFTAYVWDEPLYRVLDVPVFIDVPEAERPRLAAAFERLAYWRGRSELSAALRVRSELLDILAVYLECGGGGVKMRTEKTGAMAKMDLVLQFIDEHLAEPLAVEELAALAHYHPNYFIRSFKRATGLSPIQYINRQRMERAKRLFATTELNVSEVADRFGMEISYFSRLFKETTGFTPSQYREWMT